MYVSLFIVLFVWSRRCRQVSRVSQTKRNMKALKPNLVILVEVKDELTEDGITEAVALVISSARE